MIYEMTDSYTFWQAKLHYRHSITIMISWGVLPFLSFLFWFEEEKQRIRERAWGQRRLSAMFHLRYSCIRKWVYTNADQRLCAYYYKKQKLE